MSLAKVRVVESTIYPYSPPTCAEVSAWWKEASELYRQQDSIDFMGSQAQCAAFNRLWRQAQDAARRHNLHPAT